MKRGLFLVIIVTTMLWKEGNCTDISKAEENSNGNNSKQSRTDLCASSSRRRFADETRADVYYFCNKNKEGKWTMYSFTCPKNTFFIQSLEKCSRLEFPPVSPSKVESPKPKEKESQPQLSYYSTAEPYVIHSWSESLQKIQSLINKSKVDKVSTTRKPSSVTATSEDPWKNFFQHGLALSTAKPVSYGGSSDLISSTEIPSLSTSTPPNLQKTKINSLSSVQVSTGTQKVTTEPTSTTTTVPLSKQDELVVRDFIIKNTKPLLPFPGSDNYIWSQPLFPSGKQPLQLPLALHSTKLPSGKGKPKLKVKLPMPKPTNGFSVQLLERFGVKLIPEDQFFFKRKPTLLNFTSTVYSSPEETTIYDTSSHLANPVHLPNHLRPLLLPPLWPSSDAETSRDRNSDSTEGSNSSAVKSVSRKPRV